MSMPTCMKEAMADRLNKIRHNMTKKCKTCGGQSFIFLDENFYRDCPDCIMVYRKIKEYLCANIRGEYLKITLDNSQYESETKEALQEIIRVIDDCVGSYNFLFHRSELKPSYGITTAGMLLVRALVDLKYESYVIEYTNLIDCFFNFTSDKKLNEDKLQKLQWLTEIEVLMIDNLEHGNIVKTKTNEFIYNKVAEFLNTRKMNSAMTIICSDIPNQTVLQESKGPLANLLKTHYVPIEILGKPMKNQPRATDKFATEFPALKNIIKVKPRVAKTKEPPKGVV